MYGRYSKPCRVYSFRAKLHKEDEKRAIEILRLANRYKNGLIELERERRAKVDGALIYLVRSSEKLTEQFGEMFEIYEELDKVEEDYKVLREYAAQEKIQLQSSKLTNETKGRFKELKKRRGRLYDKLGLIRRKLFKLDEWKPLGDSIEAERVAEGKALRALFSKEHKLHWGTRGAVEAARAKDNHGAPPRFVRFEGNGCITVQDNSCGGFLRDAVEGAKGVLAKQFQVSDETCPVSGGKFNLARIRVGSDGRKPIWLPFRVQLHKRSDGFAVPQDALVKSARLVARRVGANTVWKFQLVLQRDSWEPESRPSEAVAIMPGWSKIQEPGGIRVGTYWGTDGERGIIELPGEQVHRYRKTVELQAVRDSNFNEIKRALKELTSKAPEWFLGTEEGQEGMRYVRTWGSQARLAAVVVRWRDNRWEGDDIAFTTAEAWRKQDKHLWEWESHQRRKVLKFRKALYRRVASKLSKRYGTVILPDINWSELNRKKDEVEDDGVKERKEVKELRKLACVSSLIECVSHTMKAVKVDHYHISTYCGNCGEACPCECGLDKRHSTTLNLLRRYLTEEEWAAFYSRKTTTDELRLVFEEAISGEEEEGLINEEGKKI